MKLLLENWREYLKEEEEYSITPEQNQALKKLYIYISKMVEGFRNFYEENPKYRKMNPRRLVKNNLFNIEEFNFELKSSGFLIKDNSFLEPMPFEPKGFLVVLNINRSAGGSYNDDPRYGGKLQINDILIPNLVSLKSTIQHELQHIFDKGTNLYGAEDLVSKIKYLFHEGELRAHTKQFAYIYHKLFPEEENFDALKFVEKMKEVGDKPSSKPIVFFDMTANPEKLQPLFKKFNLFDHANEFGGIEGIKRMNEKAIKYTEYYLTLFKRRENETPT